MVTTVTEAASGPYYPNGATVSFPFGFKVAARDEVSVLLISPDGGEEVIDPAGYSVILAADGEGGTVTMTAPVANDGRQLWIVSNPSFEQNILFEDEGPFNSAVLNPVADRSAIRDIWLRNRQLRSLTLPFGESAPVLPLATARRGKVLGFNPVDGGFEAKGPELFQGSPGGNIMAVGSFTAVYQMAIPSGTTIIQTSGKTRGILIEDASLTDADVAKFPAIICKSANGRFWRRDTSYLTARQLGVDLSVPQAGVFKPSASALIQQGIDYLQRFNEGFGQYYTLWLDPGCYRMTEPVVRRSCSLVVLGGRMYTGALWYWDGAIGGTLLQEDSVLNPGNLSFGEVSGITFDGAGKADYGYDMLPNPNVVDAGFLLDGCYFASSRKAGIRHGSWVNLHWRDLRFDGPGEWAIDARMTQNFSNASYSIDDFTYDNQHPDQTGRPSFGFMKLTLMGAANKGIVSLSSARIEQNGGWVEGVDNGLAVGKSLISVDSGGQYFNVTLVLNEIELATDAGATASGPYAIVRHISDGPAQPISLNSGPLSFTNPDAWKFFSGNIAASQVNPPVRSVFHSVSLDNTFGGARRLSSAQFLAAQQAAQFVLRHYLADEAAPRFAIRGDGFLAFGNGAIDPPPNLVGFLSTGEFSAGGKIVLQLVAPPAAAGSPGRPGQIAISGNVIFICMAVNSWRAIDTRAI